MKNILLTLMLIASFGLHAQQDYDKKLNALGIVLFTPAKPIANYVKVVQSGKLLFVSGHGPMRADETYIIGKVGKDLTLEQGYQAARQTAISSLSTLKAELGDLNRVKRIVKVNGWVNCHSDFTDQPKVINGCSDLLVEVFGENGKHARAAVGTNSLPRNMAVEVEMIIELE